MDNKCMIDALLFDSINRAMQKLGIEKTLETIESISNSTLRMKLRQEYFKIIADRLDKQ